MSSLGIPGSLISRPDGCTRPPPNTPLTPPTLPLGGIRRLKGVRGNAAGDKREEAKNERGGRSCKDQLGLGKGVDKWEGGLMNPTNTPLHSTPHTHMHTHLRSLITCLIWCDGSTCDAGSKLAVGMC